MAERSSTRKRTNPRMVLQDTKKQRSLTPRMRRRANRAKLKKQRLVAIALAIMLLIAVLAVIAIWQLKVSPNETEAATQSNTAFERFPVELDRVIDTSIKHEEAKPVDMAVQDEAGYFIDPVSNILCSFDYNDKTVRKLNLSESLNEPLAVDIHRGNVYIADSGAARIAIVSHGKVSSIAVPTGDTLAQPSGIRVLDNGDILVSDAANHRVVQIRPDGGVVRIIGTGLKEDTNIGLDAPSGVTVDSKGDIYIADTMNARIQKFSPEGKYLATYGKLSDSPAKLSRPVSVAVDNGGHIYVADSKKNAIFTFSQDDKLLGFIGNPANERNASNDVFGELAGIIVFEDRLFVADYKGLIHIYKLP